MRRWLVLLGCALFFHGNICEAASIYQDRKAPLESRVNDLLSRLTLEEKISLLSGDASGFATQAIPRLGLPSIQMTDGPLGVRFGVATAFPAGIAMGATFDPELMHDVAEAMAIETRALGRDMLLAPCVNLTRHPFGGRNFESFGEDPFLSTMIALGYLKGLQSQSVIPSLKHFALNEQEHKRFEIDVISDERSMNELHFPAFRALVNAGVWSVMASYNKVNGHWASENSYLLTEILKNKWGFRGFVVSDWWATHSTIKAAEAGLDLEMPNNTYFGAPLLEAVRNRAVSESLVNDKVSRILRAIFGSGLFDNQNNSRPSLAEVGSAKHLALAKKAAEQSIVLLKNDYVAGEEALLPLDLSKLRSVAVIGAGAKFSRVNGGGSSMVNPTRVITPLDALRERAPEVLFTHALGAPMRHDFDTIQKALWFQDRDAKIPGLRAEYFNNKDFSGTPSLTRVDPAIDFDWAWNSPGLGIGLNGFTARWVGFLKSPVTEPSGFTLRADDGVRLYVDGTLLFDAWNNIDGEKFYTVPYTVEAGRTYEVRLEYRQEHTNSVMMMGFGAPAKDELAEAVSLAQNSDAAIVFVGLSRYYEGEGFDRDTMGLPEGQDELVRRVRAANPRTIVVVNAGNPVEMPWAASIDALIYGWYGGQEGGYAIADLLLGNKNPSGKLPITLPKRWEDSPAFGFYPEDPGQANQVTYGEGIYLGYRHFDTMNVEPLFPFGFGLSYTQFEMQNLRLQVASFDTKRPILYARLDITNRGVRAGSEVVQFYVEEKNPKVDRPARELKAFRKVFLQPGETKSVVVPLKREAFAYYDVNIHDWNVSAGTFTVRAGSSSRHLPLAAEVVLKDIKR